MPAQTEVLLHVRNSRPLDPDGRVVPTDPAARDVRRRVPRIAAVEGEVDASDEGDAAVDHDDLFVVTVGEAGAPVRVRHDLRVVRQRLEHLAHLAL